MKFYLILLLVSFWAFPLFSQTQSWDKFSLAVYGGKSFLGYGDIWGIDRNISIQYGNKYYISLEYEFADFEGAEFSEQFYENLSNSTLVTKYMNNIFGTSQNAFFGLKSLDVKDNLITINSYNLKAGSNWGVFHNRLKVGIFGVLGLHKLSKIGFGFIATGFDLTSPDITIKDVIIFGTYTHRFIDYNFGFGFELGYQLLPERLQINLFAKAQRGAAVWSTVGLGTRVNI